MSREQIDWTAQFIDAPQVNTVRSSEMMRGFLLHALTEVAPLHIPVEVEDRVKAAGCRVQGTRYFSVLYSKDPDVTQYEKVKSVFTGSVAHGRQDLASEAYGLMTARRDVGVVKVNLVDQLTKAIKIERWNNGELERIERLEGAAKALGKSLSRRVVGGIATDFIRRRLL